MICDQLSPLVKSTSVTKIFMQYASRVKSTDNCKVCCSAFANETIHKQKSLKGTEPLCLCCWEESVMHNK